jgi:hypothetical protein
LFRVAVFTWFNCGLATTQEISITGVFQIGEFASKLWETSKLGGAGFISLFQVAMFTATFKPNTTPFFQMEEDVLAIFYILQYCFQCPQLSWCCCTCLPSLPTRHFFDIVILHSFWA